MDLTEAELKQVAFEEDLQRTSIYKYAERIAKLRENRSESLTDPVIHTMSRFIDPMRDGIRSYMDAALRKPGVRAVAYRLLENADLDVVALLALRSALDSISRPRRIQTVAVRIGREVEQEMRFAAFQESHGGLYHTVQKNIHESPHAYRRDYRKAVLTYAANKFEVPWEPWSEEDRDHVGTFLIHVMIEHTGLVELRRYKDPKGRGTRIDVAGTDEFVDWLDQQHDRLSVLKPKRLPMLCEPRDWEGLEGGGYLTPEMQRPLVRLRRREYAHLYTRDNMPAVFDAINYIQKVPYRINKDVLEVAQRMWDLHQDLPKAAYRDDSDLPIKPPKGAASSLYKKYKKEARDIHFRNQRNKGRRLVVTQLLSIARQFRRDSFWFPYHLDFRGRTYASTQYITPQGSDLSKGLLRFRDGKPLGRRGAWWLAVHVANTYGEDKVSLDDRVAWTHEVSDWLVDIANDPMRNRDWHDADKPFQFLAACMEWKGFIEQGEAFSSTLAIEIDGSCNGIQHLAAMTRDAEAGKLVNLIPADKPSDIYREVAAKTTELVEAMKRYAADSSLVDLPESLIPMAKAADENPELHAFPEMWLAYGINRNLCKRQTMILPYNGTMKAVRDYTFDYIADKEEETKEKFFADKGSAANWLGSIMWIAMTEVVTGPRLMMDWVAKVASVANEQDAPLVWETPSGFITVQAYPSMSSARVKTRVGDTVYKHTLTFPSQTELDKQRQARASAPNLIHGFDAAMLHLVSLALAESGIPYLRVIHDGFGTHAADTDTLLDALKQVFIEQYNGEDLRKKFLDDITRYAGIDTTEVPPPPVFGSLDIELVAEADYFFA